MKSVFIYVSLLGLVAPTASLATPPPAVKNLKITKSAVEFLAVGRPSAIKIRGKSQTLESQLQWKNHQLEGLLRFDLNSLDTGIELRTEHMKEKYLETAKHRYAELSLKALPLSAQICKEDLALKKNPFFANLKLHGVERPVQGDFDLTATAGQGRAEVRFDLNISDFQIEIPVYMGIKVADKVEHLVVLEWTCVP